MAFIAVAIIAAGAISAYSAIEAGKQAERDAKAQQAALNQQAELARKKGEAERERALEEVRQFEKEGEAFQATQQVQLAKGGVLASIETPAMVLERTAQELEADKLTIMKEGYLAESFGESGAFNLRFQGEIARARGKAAKTASYYSAAGSILSSVGSASIAKSSFSSATNRDAALAKKHGIS